MEKSDFSSDHIETTSQVSMILQFLVLQRNEVCFSIRERESWRCRDCNRSRKRTWRTSRHPEGQTSKTLNFQVIEYTDIPFMPTTTVIGHGKALYRGLIGDKKVLCWQGKICLIDRTCSYVRRIFQYATYLHCLLLCIYGMQTSDHYEFIWWRM